MCTYVWCSIKKEWSSLHSKTFPHLMYSIWSVLTQASLPHHFTTSTAHMIASMYEICMYVLYMVCTLRVNFTWNNYIVHTYLRMYVLAHTFTRVIACTHSDIMHTNS